MLEKSPHLYRIRNFHPRDPSYWFGMFTNTCGFWYIGKPPHGIRDWTQVRFPRVAFEGGCLVNHRTSIESVISTLGILVIGLECSPFI